MSDAHIDHPQPCELEQWLRKEAAKRSDAAKSRRGYARAGLSCTDEDRAIAHSMAEQSLGRKITKTTRAEDKDSADIQERIAGKLDREAEEITRFGDFIRSLQAQLQEVQKERDMAREQAIVEAKFRLDIAEQLQRLQASAAIMQQNYDASQDRITNLHAERGQLQAELQAVTRILRRVRASGVACSFMGAGELAHIDAVLTREER